MAKKTYKAPEQKAPQRLTGAVDPNLRRPPGAGGPRRAMPQPPPTAMPMPRKKGLTPTKAFLWAMGITGTGTGLGLWLF